MPNLTALEFKERLAASATAGGDAARRVILACDYDIGDNGASPADMVARAIQDIRATSPYLCAIKLNFHLLLPLGTRHIMRITKAAHACGLQAIADVKLNDIGNTNRIAAGALWDAGFDALIANPIMGPSSLSTLVESAHAQDRGIITLCHMSAPEARISYEMHTYPTKRSKNSRSLYETFLNWALRSGADGIIVGATFPDIIQRCAKRLGRSRRQQHTAPLIISPGVGAQGADAASVISAGSDYIIAGRSIITSDDPARAARLLHDSLLRSEP